MGHNFKIIVIGLGTQGQKRKQTALADFSGSVDPVNPEATYRSVSDVPTNEYDAAFVCTPETKKIEIINFLINKGKHILCEKPLLATSIDELNAIEQNALENNCLLYTAYNHRFEPSLVEAAKIIESDKLGTLYKIRIFYGNGTAKLVKDSPWRDQGTGVISDIGSHLIDLIDFLLPAARINYKLLEANCFENEAFDQARISSLTINPLVDLEMTFCSWRNTFSCDIIGEYGSLHIQGLCKWGISTLTFRKRVFPAGMPSEVLWEFPQGDPTWKIEYEFFKSLISGGQVTDLSKDRYIMQEITSVGRLLGNIR